MSIQDGYGVLSKAAKGKSLNDEFGYVSAASAHHLHPLASSGNAVVLNAQGRGFGYGNTPFGEVERQTMIRKYLMSGIPVAPDLASLSLYRSGDLCRKGDAERGRCKRTDGKKWRCSKDAAPDQKYCERHLHRGRPRSRKPVERCANPFSEPLSKKTKLPTSSSTGVYESDAVSQLGEIRTVSDYNPETSLLLSCDQPRGIDWFANQASFQDESFDANFLRTLSSGEDSSFFYPIGGYSSWAAEAIPGGPLGEILRMSSANAAAYPSSPSGCEFGFSPSATAASSPSGFFQKSLLSDSSGNSSPIPTNSTANMSEIALLWLDQSRGHLTSNN